MKRLPVALTALAASGVAGVAAAQPQPVAVQPVAPAIDAPVIAQSAVPIDGCAPEDWLVLGAPNPGDELSGGMAEGFRGQANLDYEGYTLIAYWSSRESVVMTAVGHPEESEYHQTHLLPELEPLLGDCAAIGRDVLRNALAD